jgi:hypothetical protein
MKKKHAMTNLERHHLLDFCKKYDIDNARIDSCISYQENLAELKKYVPPSAKLSEFQPDEGPGPFRRWYIDGEAERYEASFDLPKEQQAQDSSQLRSESVRNPLPQKIVRSSQPGFFSCWCRGEVYLGKGQMTLLPKRFNKNDNLVIKEPIDNCNQNSKSGTESQMPSLDDVISKLEKNPQAAATGPPKTGKASKKIQRNAYINKPEHDPLIKILKSIFPNLPDPSLDKLHESFLKLILAHPVELQNFLQNLQGQN